ncbi:hypothetical protein [Desulforamulus aeronauticus]|uniref:Uncharacterized protein n=1 Tax=Desulforamulus aeronauticus DSM 10349 TaxID=1121421 RepID=A0A1M6WF33_9FIRM|nr:hypothetical protein [Desulforamulus aeronauticus]SHK92317.1 hypothetical protein SAMN02745123_03598 [Desulforamulus aeronauticus DSM 10349]
MSRRKDPVMLENFRFLPEHLKEKVKSFVSLLDDPCQKFAEKRYLEGMNISAVADEMGYSERSIYNIRDLVIDRWDFYTNNNKSDYDKMRKRIITVLERFGSLRHYKLTNIIVGCGCTKKEISEVIQSLVNSGDIICNQKHTKGRPARIYSIPTYSGEFFHQKATRS